MMHVDKYTVLVGGHSEMSSNLDPCSVV